MNGKNELNKNVHIRWSILSLLKNQPSCSEGMIAEHLLKEHIEFSFSSMKSRVHRVKVKAFAVRKKKKFIDKTLRKIRAEKRLTR